jgi:glycerate kinase
MCFMPAVFAPTPVLAMPELAGGGATAVLAVCGAEIAADKLGTAEILASFGTAVSVEELSRACAQASNGRERDADDAAATRTTKRSIERMR